MGKPNQLRTACSSQVSSPGHPRHGVVSVCFFFCLLFFLSCLLAKAASQFTTRRCLIAACLLLDPSLYFFIFFFIFSYSYSLFSFLLIIFFFSYSNICCFLLLTVPFDRTNSPSLKHASLVPVLLSQTSSQVLP